MAVKVLQDIWIVSEGGIVLFHRVLNKNIDTLLFGGLMSALDSFAEQISTGGLSHFELNNKRFLIKKKGAILVISTSDMEAKPKKAMKELNSITDKFIDQYSKIYLNDWDGQISLFRNFIDEIEGS